MTKADSNKIQYWINKNEIQDLLNLYCRAADRRDHKAMRELYHPDAIDDHGGFFKGLATDFIDKLPEIQAPMEILHHNITTVNIEIDGNYAEGEVYVLAFHTVAGPDGPTDVLIGGRYLDKYEKREDTWKFSHRAVVADWVKIDSPSSVDLSHPFVDGSHIGCSGRDDPSYKFFDILK